MKRSTPPGGSNPLRWIILHTRGVIYDQHTRRQTMFYSLVVGMLMFFAGEVFFFPDWRKADLRVFCVYYLICGWLTVLAALLALFDIILLRVQDRIARRQLREKIFSEKQVGRVSPPDA